MTMLLEEWMVFILIIISIGLGALSVFFWVRGSAPEAFLMAQCRLKKVPLGRIFWANGRETLEALHKSDDGSMFFEKNGKPFKVDLRMYQQGKASWMNGLEIVNIYTDSLLPIGNMDLKSIYQTLEYLRDPANDFKRLAEIPDDRYLMILINTPDEELAEYLAGIVHVDFTGLSQDQAAQKLGSVIKEYMDEIKRAKSDLSRLPVMSGVFCIPTALGAIDNTLTNKICNEIEIELREMQADDMDKKERMLMWIFAILSVIIGGAIGAAIVFNVLSGGGAGK
jgi:hypothetical protein